MENTYDSKCKTDITKIKQDYRIETVDKSITVYSTIFEAMEKADALFPDANIFVIIKDSKGKTITKRYPKDADPNLTPGVDGHSENEFILYPCWLPLNL